MIFELFTSFTFLYLVLVYCLYTVRDGTDTMQVTPLRTQRLLLNPNALVVVSKGMLAVKVFSYKILQFGRGRSRLTQVVMYNGRKTVTGSCVCSTVTTVHDVGRIQLAKLHVRPHNVHKVQSSARCAAKCIRLIPAATDSNACPYVSAAA